MGSPRRARGGGSRGIALAAALLVAACATPPEDPVARAAFDEAADPLEPFNRFMFDSNQAVDEAIIKPVATAYRDVVPEPLRDALRNLLRNLRAPLIFAHDLLQGEPRRAGVTLQRFLLNSAFGFAGLVDVADLAVGLKFHDEDFGQTLGVWGMGEGFYLILPIIGPSSGRDVLGLVVDSAIDPVSYGFAYYDINYGPPARMVLTALDARSRAIDSLDDVKKTSIDFYAALRSLYRQKREDEILNGRPPPGGRRSPTLESPLVDAAGKDAPTPSAVSPAIAAAAIESAPLPSAPPPPVSAEARREREEAEAWSAWAAARAPALAFNPPPAPPPLAEGAGAPAQLASYRPAAAVPAPAMQPAAMTPAAAPPAPAADSTRPVAVILFANGQAGLGPNDRALLRQVAALAQRSGAGLRVVGHAGDRAAGLDELDRRFFNFDVSWARASAAAEELERAGLPFQRIVIEAKGETEPLDVASAADAPRNRRVNIYLE